MKTTKTNFVRKPLAAAVMCSAIGLSPAVFGATIEKVNTDNLADPPVEGKTLVYTDTAGTATFGWFDPVNDSGGIGLGMSVYNEIFSAAGETFQGCIMAETELGPAIPDSENPQERAPNCLAPGDSGKRFKLKTTETNGPIDLVFNVTADEASKLYRVIGKFSNLTAALNDADGDLKAFRFETGFGVGNEFMSSSADDGLSFGIDTDGVSKISAGDLGKFPGGLFGGSRVEGLPFFSVSVADFVEGSSSGNEDVIETDGIIATEYSDLFGDWRALSQVPTGWFIDHDGNPANDSILLAWDAGDTGVIEESGWQTYQKVFAAGDVSVDYDGDEATDPLSIPIVNWDPNGSSFAEPVTAEDGSTITDYVNNVRPLVETLGEGDDDPDNDAISLVRSAATDLYSGDYEGSGEGFKVLIDGNAVEIAPFTEWADTPVTIRDSAVDGDMLTDASKFVVWNPEALDGEGAYEANPAYTGAYVFSDYDLDGDSALSLTEVSSAGFFAEGSTDTLARWPGYVQGAIEDLANVNINTSVAVSGTSSWPTCTGDGTVTSCTFTLRVTGLNDAVEEPVIPPSPVVPEPEPEEPSASSSDGDGTIFGCTSGKPGSPFDPVLPSMVLMALAGLWARKRRGAA